MDTSSVGPEKEAYKRGYAAAEREYKQALTKAYESVQELSDQLADLDARKSDLEKWREALPHLDMCPLCHTELKQTFAVTVLRDGAFLPKDATDQQIALAKRRVLQRLMKKAKDYACVSEGSIPEYKKIMITAEIAVGKKGEPGHDNETGNTAAE